MATLTELVGQFSDEVKGVHEYAKCAEKAGSPQDHQMYQRMAQAEMEHAEMLSEAIGRFADVEMDAATTRKCLDDILDGVKQMAKKELASARACLEESR